MKINGKEAYGKEIILDMWDCDPKKMNRTKLREFFKVLCKKIDMQKELLCFWDDVGVPKEYKETEPHLIGTSAVQFIKTSNITIHTLTVMKRVYLNIFSCKDFDPKVAEKYCKDFFKGKVKNSKVIIRR